MFKDERKKQNQQLMNGNVCNERDDMQLPLDAVYHNIDEWL